MFNRLGGTLLAWALNNGLTYPFNFYFSFMCMAAAHGVGACLSFLLPLRCVCLDNVGSNSVCSINERAPMSELVR